MGGRIARLNVQSSIWEVSDTQDHPVWHHEPAEAIIADPREADRMTFRLEGRTIIVQGLIKEVQEQLERCQ